MMNKTEIRVTIDSEEKKQRAIDILEKHMEKIWDDRIAMVFDVFHNSLIYSEDGNDWFINYQDESLIEITLEQLDELLTKEKQK